MIADPWLPIGYMLPGGALTGSALLEGAGWQIYSTQDGGRVLIARNELIDRWIEAKLIDAQVWQSIDVAGEAFGVLVSTSAHALAPVQACPRPTNRAEAVALASALKRTRDRVPNVSLGDAIYVERFSCLLPGWSEDLQTSDEQVLGSWIAGGVRVAASSVHRLESLNCDLSTQDLTAVLHAAGIQPASTQLRRASARAKEDDAFELPGRPDLERFFREHVIDVVQHPERYSALGVRSPGAIVLHGPPGTGKTFAVEALVEFLGWPSFAIDSQSIGSPYIHETGRKIAKVFDDAMKAAPSVIVIDEMESFLSERTSGNSTGIHHTEEVAEFLRRIPEAIGNRVLIIGLTNRIEMIDPAILRRGRFDHVISVGFATGAEVRKLLEALLAPIPCGPLDLDELSQHLAGRPLSDVSFVVREAGRLAARAGREKLDQQVLLDVVRSLPTPPGDDERRRIGFR